MNVLSAPRVCVFGSVNVDLAFVSDRYPGQGETVIGRSRRIHLGGKGANQAVAASRAGAATALIARVGADDDGTRSVRRLSELGVDVSRIGRDEILPTGCALVLVDGEGHNRIVVIPGANTALTRDDVAKHSDVIAASDVVVVQGEIPAEAALEAVNEAALRGVRTLVNLAPFFELGSSIGHADPLVVNEVEASQLVGAHIRTAEDVAVHASRLSKLAGTSVVTLGAGGAVIVDADDVTAVAAPSVDDVVDTTGAGDAFVGVVAALLAAGSTLVDAVEAAIQCASASVRYEGSAEAYPDFRALIATPGHRLAQ